MKHYWIFYVDGNGLSYQRERYVNSVKAYEDIFGVEEISIYSAPGRSEIGENHTDHQKGEVLVAAVNVDVIAIVHKTEDNCVQVVSNGYDMITL